MPELDQAPPANPFVRAVLCHYAALTASRPPSFEGIAPIPFTEVAAYWTHLRVGALVPLDRFFALVSWCDRVIIEKKQPKSAG